MTGKVLYDLLSSYTALSNVVSTRIYPARRLQADDLPAVTYNLTGNVPTNTKDGPSELDTERYSVHCWSKQYLQAATMAVNVRAALDRYSGTNNGVLVDSISFAGQTHLYEDWSEVHHIVVDFYCRIKRNL